MTDAEYIDALEHVLANAKAYIEHDFKRVYESGDRLTYGDEVLVEAFHRAESERLVRRAAVRHAKVAS